MNGKQTKTDLAYELNKIGGLPYLHYMQMTKKELLELYKALTNL